MLRKQELTGGCLSNFSLWKGTFVTELGLEFWFEALLLDSRLRGKASLGELAAACPCCCCRCLSLPLPLSLAPASVALTATAATVTAANAVCPCRCLCTAFSFRSLALLQVFHSQQNYIFPDLCFFNLQALLRRCHRLLGGSCRRA